MQDTPQDPRTAATIAAIRAFDEATRRRDIDAIMAMSTDDVVWETTTPPDGERYEGTEAVRRGMEEFFRASPEAVFEIEDVVALGERAFFTWVYRWVDGDGKPGHVRGVDTVRVRDGKIAETCAYVKG
jgi:ketosteroid isomerase-like protein